MAAVPVPNVVLAQFVHSFRGEPLINDIHFWRPDGDITSLTVQFLATGLRTAWVTNMLPLMSDDVDAIAVRCFDLTLADGPFAEVSMVGDVGGSGNAEPNNVCVSVKKSTGARGKSQRGRIFWGGIPTTGVSENNITVEYGDALVAALNNNFAGGDNPLVGWTPVVVSTVHLGAPRAAGVFLEIQEWVLVDTIVDSYRTRLPGHRRRKKKTVVA